MGLVNIKYKEIIINYSNNTLIVIDFDNAYFIKLGKKGAYEHDCIHNNRLRFGYDYISIENLQTLNWEGINADISSNFPGKKKKGTRTKVIKEITKILTSTTNDLWTTYHGTKLYWTKFNFEEINEDKLFVHNSRYCDLPDGWKSTDINNKPLYLSEIPGEIAKTRGYQGTICNAEKQALNHLINDIPSKQLENIRHTRLELIKSVSKGLGKLHQKDNELLTDLIFKASGLKRISSLGENLKFIDLELIDFLTGDRYLVQVKARSNLRDLIFYRDEFRKHSKDYRKMYYFVYNPSRDLLEYSDDNTDFLLMLPNQIAEKVVEFGLIDWLMHKIW
jgi:hypothetical protein